MNLSAGVSDNADVDIKPIDGLRTLLGPFLFGAPLGSPKR